MSWKKEWQFGCWVSVEACSCGFLSSYAILLEPYVCKTKPVFGYGASSFMLPAAGVKRSEPDAVQWDLQLL